MTIELKDLQPGMKVKWKSKNKKGLTEKNRHIYEKEGIYMGFNQTGACPMVKFPEWIEWQWVEWDELTPIQENYSERESNGE